MNYTGLSFKFQVCCEATKTKLSKIHIAPFTAFHLLSRAPRTGLSDELHEVFILVSLLRHPKAALDSDGTVDATLHGVHYLSHQVWTEHEPGTCDMRT